MVVPAVSPFTTPVVGFTGATDGALLIHVPLPVASVSVIVDPMQTPVGPDIIPGAGFIVITVLVEQPVLAV